jgi:uncharacterized protein (PEP-CTERM system associated)
VYGRYTRKWTRVDLITDLGYSWLKYSGGNLRDRSDPLGRVDLIWRTTDRSTFTVSGGYLISDAASDMLAGTEVIGTGIPTTISTGEATVTSQALLERRASLTYAYRGDRGVLSVSPYYRKLDYLDTLVLAEDGLGQQTSRGGTATLSWKLRPLVTIGVTGAAENTRYGQIAREDKTWSVLAFLNYQLTRNWSWRANIARYSRDSSTPGQSYDQNVLFLAVTYTR